MYQNLKNKYFVESRHKYKLLNESFTRLKTETKANISLIEKVYNTAYWKFIEHFNLKEIVPGTPEFSIFESFVYKSIKLTNGINNNITESTVSGDVAVYIPPLGKVNKRRKDLNPNKVPTFECTWKEFKHFIKDETTKEKTQEDMLNDFLSDKELDDEFKMELLKSTDDMAKYLKYFDYLVKITKQKDKEDKKENK